MKFKTASFMLFVITMLCFAGCGDPPGTKAEGPRPAAGQEERPAPLEPE